ncbi:MAG: FAD-dependent oxidoreductase [Imperialibacter sp.]
MHPTFTRRDFVKLSSILAAALATQPVQALSINDPWQKKRGAKQKVVIVGAGMSGLAAGMELRNLGHDVQIVEGQMRAGGRVFTARNMFADGLYADMGAARIPEDHEWTMKYVKQYGLELYPFNPSEGGLLHMVKGKKIRYTSNQPAPLKDYPFSLTPKEVAMDWAGISTQPFQSIMTQVGDARDLSWPPAVIAGYDKLTFKEFLVSEGYSPDIAGALMLGWEEAGEKGLYFSILEMVRETSLSFGATRNKIVGGNDLLPRALAKDLGQLIQYGSKVLAVDQDDTGVSITVDRGGERSTLRADRVICTLPLPLLKKMDFVKTLSSPKQTAINNMGGWNLGRTAMQVKDRYWRKGGLTGFAATDLPSEIWDPHYESDATRGIIAHYVKSRDAGKFMTMGAEKRLAFSANHVDSVFPGLKPQLEGAFIKVWGEDPWAGYAHAIGTPNDLTRHLPHLITAEGRIHFAGEHASAYHGWIQGAIESGNRTAKEINSF